MEKIVISNTEVAATASSLDQPARQEPKLGPTVPWWARAALSLLIVALPILCLVSIILRVAIRGLPPRTQHAWTSFLATLLIISGLLTFAAMVVSFSLAPLPPLISEGLTELDERTEFPILPVDSPMSPKEVSEKLKPLVAVVSFARRSRFSRQEIPSGGLGAGTLLQANANGFLFVTASHVLDSAGWSPNRNNQRGLLAMASGTWGAADVIARHEEFDLLLLWMRRRTGYTNFEQPLAVPADVIDGETVFVIGHPEGYRFTLSTGIISRTDKSGFQMSAPISPGNSGGPVFDGKGNLLGIVISTVNKQLAPNAENLNFAIRASALLQDSGWEFFNNGQQRLSDYRSGRDRSDRGAQPN